MVHSFVIFKKIINSQELEKTVKESPIYPSPGILQWLYPNIIILKYRREKSDMVPFVRYSSVILSHM